MIEELLRETLDQVAAGGPGEAGAYDRFLRRRARQTRRMAATGAVGLALLLALVAVLPGQWRGGDDHEEGSGGGPAQPARWRPGPRDVAAPLQGFEVLVPPGWEVQSTEHGFELRPIAEDLRRQLPTPIQLDTVVLDPKDHPQGAELFRDNNGWAGDISGRIGQGDVRTTGSFAGGRRWLRTDSGTPGRRTTVWYTPWPYRCQGGEPCPDVLSLRMLRVAITGAGDHVWARAMELAPALLKSARPTTNAVAGRAHARRPACVDGVTSWPSVDSSQYLTSPRTVRVIWRFRTSAQLIPCHFRRMLRLSILDGGRPVRLDGDDRLVLEGDLPEGKALAPGFLGVEWRWTNWCGGDVRIRFRGGEISSVNPSSGDLVTPSAQPECADPSRPTRLEIVEWGE
jgi:hypothetical protein